MALIATAPPAAAPVHALHATSRKKPAKAKKPSTHSPRRSTATGKRQVRTSSTYVVRPGDTLTSIAASHHVGIAALMKANHIGNPNYIQAGARLVMPGQVGSAPTRSTKTTARKKPLGAPRLSTSRAANEAALAARPAPSRSQAKSLIEHTARRYGVNTKLALGIAWQESGWNQRAVSSCNAIGIMQVMPQSGTWASDLVGRRLNIMEAQDNVTAGVAILRYLTSNSSNLDEAIGAYYQGLAGIRAHGPYADTKAYVRNVKAIMARQ
ncbi:lytic transglycosylase [Rudaeicoccus suwonensis]|uniref:LysM domain-containing protein n=1 Tax=Rudaeicoccus suwonensis TaxID=657409 RepID=A0A561EBL1_9MICO|nr:transglycosylase SLT domain-containing protein [Rudaeicoccus suwonensis]TWE13004.1 LysM domain-containing protein [Rudaeicoccus suwonensis]